ADAVFENQQAVLQFIGPVRGDLFVAAGARVLAMLLQPYAPAFKDAAEQEDCQEEQEDPVGNASKKSAAEESGDVRHQIFHSEPFSYVCPAPLSSPETDSPYRYRRECGERVTNGTGRQKTCGNTRA